MNSTFYIVIFPTTITVLKISPPGQVKLPIQVNANDLQKIYYQDICGNLGKINLKLSFQDVVLYYLIGEKKVGGKLSRGKI